MTRTRNLIVLVLVIFIVYAIVTAPYRSANVVNELWDAITHGLRSIGTFFTALIRG